MHMHLGLQLGWLHLFLGGTFPDGKGPLLFFSKGTVIWHASMFHQTHPLWGCWWVGRGEECCNLGCSAFSVYCHFHPPHSVRTGFLALGLGGAWMSASWLKCQLEKAEVMVTVWGDHS